MKSIVSYTFLLFFIATVHAQHVGDSFTNARSSKTARLIYIHDATPKLVEGSAGSESGLLVDIMNEFGLYIRDKYGIQVTPTFVQQTDFVAFMQDVKAGSGGVFGLSNISITEDRKAEYAFSPSYLDNISVLLTSNQVASLSSMDEIQTAFAGMKAYTIEGSTQKLRIEKIRDEYLPDLKIEILASTTDVMNALVSDPKSFSALDLVDYLGSEIRGQLRRHAVADADGDQFGVIMPKNSDWEPIMKEFFDAGFINGYKYRKMLMTNLR
ncbi:MAG: transporter substrate-binding domain-containing protein [Cyclobacteriaceae bacterium]